MKVMAIISYDGSGFSGYQVQKNKRTVQEEFESVLYKIGHKEIKINASGRTDSSVHAINQVISFDIDINIELESLKRAINSLLPSDIFVKDIKEAKDDFHARYSVIKKKYTYYINTGKYDVFKRDYVYQYNNNLDVDSMIDGIKHFIGKHNFTSFTPTKNIQSNYERMIYEADISVNEDTISISFIGNGFLRYMVRNMVGCLIAVGENKIRPDTIKEFLEKEDRKCCYKTASPEGLYLDKVYYE